MSNVIELDNTFSMTPEQTLIRATREPYKAVIVLGVLEDDSHSFIFSHTTEAEAYWLLQKAAHCVIEANLDG